MSTLVGPQKPVGLVCQACERRRLLQAGSAGVGKTGQEPRQFHRRPTTRIRIPFESPLQVEHRIEPRQVFVRGKRAKPKQQTKVPYVVQPCCIAEETIERCRKIESRLETGRLCT